MVAHPALVRSAGLSRAQAPAVAAEAAAAEPGTHPLQGSPIHPGTSASPVAAEAAAEVAVAEAVAAEVARD